MDDLEFDFPLSMGILLKCLSSPSECFRRFAVLETPFFQPLRFKVAEMRKAHPISFISPKSEEFEWMGAGPGR